MSFGVGISAKRSGARPDDRSGNRPTRVLIAGASRGLGLALCAAFAERGAEVIAACRRSPAGLAAVAAEVLDGVELTDEQAVARIAGAVRAPLDVLVYNAGVNEDAPELAQIETSTLMRSFDVNALGAVRVVLALLPLLSDRAKLVFLGTGSHALNIDAPSAGNYGYRMSKAALVSFAFGLARDLRDRGIAVLVAHPGPIDTDMLREVAAAGRTSFDPDDAPSALAVARLLRARVDELTLDRSPAWHEDPLGTAVRIG